MRVSGTTRSQPFSPLFHYKDVSNRDLIAQRSSCHLCATLGTNYLMDKSYTHHPDDGGYRPSAPSVGWSSLPPTEPVGGLRASSPGAAAELRTALSWSWSTANHHLIPGLSCARGLHRLQPSNLLFTHLLRSAEQRCFPRQSHRQGLVTLRFQEDSICLSS